MDAYHIPVLLDETVDALNIKPDGLYFDGTLGGGGHSEAILKKLKSGRLIACDRDLEAINFASERLKPYKDKLTILKDNFKNAPDFLAPYGLLDGAVLDLGISSRQIDSGKRGFSYMQNAPLDMRMSADDTLTAYDIINDYTEDKLAEIFFRYGEENFAKRIARNIVEARTISTVQTTFALSDIIRRSIPMAAQKGGHPSKKVFQAVRIAVNGELDGLDKAVENLIDLLKTNGRIAVISFHSLEDRIVKTVFKELAADCICSKKLPVCTCGHKAKIKILTPRPITANDTELKANPRSAPAKLRAVERINRL